MPDLSRQAVRNYIRKGYGAGYRSSDDDEILFRAIWDDITELEIQTPKRGILASDDTTMDAMKVDQMLDLTGLTKGGLKGSWITALFELFYGIREVFYDIYKGQKPKSSGIISLIFVIGTVVGAVIGSVLLPGAGSLIGGAVGGFIAGLGGAIVLGIGFALFGGWMSLILGRKFVTKIFGEESDYELPGRALSNLTSLNPNAVKDSTPGLNENYAKKINAYLMNRSKSVRGIRQKRFYENLARVVFHNPNVSKSNIYLLHRCLERELVAVNHEKHRIELYEREFARLENGFYAQNTKFSDYCAKSKEIINAAIQNNELLFLHAGQEMQNKEKKAYINEFANRLVLRKIDDILKDLDNINEEQIKFILDALFSHAPENKFFYQHPEAKILRQKLFENAVKVSEDTDANKKDRAEELRNFESSSDPQDVQRLKLLISSVLIGNKSIINKDDFGTLLKDHIDEPSANYLKHKELITQFYHEAEVWHHEKLLEKDNKNKGALFRKPDHLFQIPGGNIEYDKSLLAYLFLQDFDPGKGKFVNTPINLYARHKWEQDRLPFGAMKFILEQVIEKAKNSDPESKKLAINILKSLFEANKELWNDKTKKSIHNGIRDLEEGGIFICGTLMVNYFLIKRKYSADPKKRDGKRLTFNSDCHAQLLSLFKPTETAKLSRAALLDRDYAELSDMYFRVESYSQEIGVKEDDIVKPDKLDGVVIRNNLGFAVRFENHNQTSRHPKHHNTPDHHQVSINDGMILNAYYKINQSDQAQGVPLAPVKNNGGDPDDESIYGVDLR